VGENLSYPVADMVSTAKKIEQIAEEQWNQHVQLFLNASPALAPLTLAIARLIPDAGSRVSSLQDAAARRQQQFQACYDALQRLAHHLEQTANEMTATDQQSAAPGFQSSSEIQ
jgi:uncharacterized protein YukE